MRSGLVCDLPYPVDLDQIMEVRRYRGSVPDDLHRSDVSHLCHRDDPTDNAPARQRRLREQDQRAWATSDLAESSGGRPPTLAAGAGESFTDVILRLAVGEAGSNL
jgi:hypothetical protein